MRREYGKKIGSSVSGGDCVEALVVDVVRNFENLVS